MNYLVIDTESTGRFRESHGSALDPRNRLCYIGCSDSNCLTLISVEYEVGIPFGNGLDIIRHATDSSDCLVFFNAKHDLHWLRRYGIKFQHKKIWDCQQAEFIINAQEMPFPSLDGTCERHNLRGKQSTLDDYAAKGIDTDGIPEQELREYLYQDVLATEQVFLKQIEYLKDKPELEKLIWVCCQDELITEEMEWNGLKFDIQGLLAKADELEQNIRKIDNALFECIGDSRINWESPQQVSSVLYGGEIVFEELERYQFHYKNSKKPPVEKIRKIRKATSFPRLVEPIARSERADGGYSTEEKILRQLKATAKAKSIVEHILERRGTQTQIDRYFRGIPQIYHDMGWEDEIIHGQLHHVVADTGRLSSSKPNIQNIDERARTCLTTRFKTLVESSLKQSESTA